MIASLPFASFTRFFFVSLLALQVKSYGVARLLGTQVYKPANHGKVQRRLFQQ